MQSTSDHAPSPTKVTHMTTSTDEGSASETLSKIACHNCRRRKVRCDRKLPVCTICTHNGQPCSYPDRMLKPGPKLGSKNVRNKRRKLTEDGGSGLEDSEIVMQYPGGGGGGIDLGGPGHGDSPRRTISMSSSTSTTTTLRNPKDIQSLSFIIHPSHESTNSPIATNDTSGPASAPITSQQHYSPGSPGDSIPNPIATTTTTTTGPNSASNPPHPYPSPSSPPNGTLILSTCTTLSIPPATLDTLVHSFFSTFPSFRLFASSRFWASTLLITDPNTVTALLAAICAFAVKLWEHPTPPTGTANSTTSTNVPIRSLSAPKLMDAAMKAASAALADCGDEPPPVALLQALVLVSHWLLIQGVRGRAWRYLGVCIRVAYELNLHLVDSGRDGSAVWEFGEDGLGASDGREAEGAIMMEKRRRWAADEERRRLWWAIWEMDVFASVIRRCPTAISWLQNETWLPCEDGRWENMLPQRSCVLEISTLARCKSLVSCGNQSPRAWFVVINSIMKDAQTVSSPVGVNTLGPGAVGYLAGAEERAGVDEGGIVKGKDGRRLHHQQQQQEGNRMSTSSRRIDEARKRLTTFYNAARYFSMALPQHLKYHGQYLSFEPSPAANAETGTKTLRELHGQIYSIHVMTQLAYLMTLKYQLFKTSIHVSSSSGAAGQKGSGRKGRSPSTNHQQQQLQASKPRRPSASIASPIDTKPPPASTGPTTTTTTTTSPSVLAYFEASTSILAITNRCAESYYRHVNPFLCNTIWLAAAVQLLRRELYVPQQQGEERMAEDEEEGEGGETERELVNSEYNVLRMSYERFVEYWRNDAGEGLGRGGARRDGAGRGGGEKGGGMDLDGLEAQLRGFRERAGRVDGGAGGGAGGGNHSGSESRGEQKQRVRMEREREKGRAAAAAVQGRRESSMQQENVRSHAPTRARDELEHEHSLQGVAPGSSERPTDNANKPGDPSSLNPLYPAHAFSYSPHTSHARSSFSQITPDDGGTSAAVPSSTFKPHSLGTSHTSPNNNEYSGPSHSMWPDMSASTNDNKMPNFNPTLLTPDPTRDPMTIDSTSSYADNAGGVTYMGDPNDFVMQDINRGSGGDDEELMMMMMFDPAYNDGFDYLGAGNGGGGYGGMGASGIDICAAGGGGGIGVNMGGNGIGGGAAGGGSGPGDHALWGGYNKFDDVFSGSIF